MRLLQQSIRLALTSTLSSSSFVASLPSSTTSSFAIMTGTTKTSSSVTKNASTVVAATPRTALEESEVSGEFIRKDSVYRNWISKESSAQYPPEKDRYHLYVAFACPWAHRTLITRALKGLEETIGVTVVHPVWRKTRPKQDEHTGWVFGSVNQQDSFPNSLGLGGPFPASFPGNEPDPWTGSSSIREVYESVNDQEGKYTVPILYDKKTKTIVSNESAEIIRMLSSEFNEFSKQPDLDIYPESMRATIDKVNDWIYPGLNNGVYRCGFAKSQEAYDKAIEELAGAFDKVDEILQKQRYIAGDVFTEADIRLFVTLLRFDEVYVVYFKTNTRSVASTPSILHYCREIYQMPGVKDTVNMEQIKAHYYCSHPTLNHYSIVPRGIDFIRLLEEPHNREELNSNKKPKLG